MTSSSTFEQLVLDHQHLVFRTLARLLGRSSDLDDLAQDVFLRLFRALPGFRGEAQITTYLYRITLNVARDEWSRRRRELRRQVPLSSPCDSAAEPEITWEDRLQHPGLDPLQELEQREFQQAVEEHLNLLSAPERAVLVLYHQEERSYLQVAEILQLPLGTVRTHLHRGRKKLRDALASSPSQPATPPRLTRPVHPTAPARIPAPSPNPAPASARRPESMPPRARPGEHRPAGPAALPKETRT